MRHTDIFQLTLAETSTPIDESLTPTPDRKMLIPPNYCYFFGTCYYIFCECHAFAGQ
jgi:hypothetical protein